MPTPFQSEPSITERLRLKLRAITPRTWRGIALLAFLILLLISSLRYADKAMKPSRVGTYTRTAFLRWRDQIQGLEDKIDIYQRYNYPNPPIMALILWPLTELPPLVGAMSWFYLKVLMVGLSFLWAFRLARQQGQPLPIWGRWLAVIFSLHPILGDLSHGNVNIFIAFLVMAALELFRRGHDLSSGIVMALAVACKVTPALFLPYFVWKRAWKTVLGMLLGLAIWFAVVPGVALGWETNTKLLTSWYNGMVRPFLVDGKVTSEHANQSIPGLVFRLLTSQPSDYAYDEDDGRPIPQEYHNVTDIGPENARLIIRACQALFVLIVIFGCRTVMVGPHRQREGIRPIAEFALIVLGMLIFSERTWKHHGVVLILPYTALAAYLAYRPTPSTLRTYIIATFVLIVILTLGPSSMPEEPQDLALTYGAYTTAYLLLSAALVGILWQETPHLKSIPSSPA